MRIATLIISVLALSQLSGCVVHRDYAQGRYNRGYATSYQTQYPSQYPGNYQTQYSEAYANQAQQPAYASQYQEPEQYQAQPMSEVAQIVGIRNIAQARESNGGGAVLGALIGGIIGNQLGKGDGNNSHHRGRGYDRGRHRDNNDDGAGRAVATVGGAILGGVIGNEIDRSSSEPQSVQTEVTFRLPNGQVQATRLANPGHLRVGDRVRVSFQGGRWVLI
ncbi:hypothetical protein H8K35_17970 [Undibacterium sp. LX40W]|uniref:Glycine zipper 2TM domain-containing protein n=1 Tax=Undibacterium nitidum TaxID=2762298 RepID=A0A923HZT0_9BURK|nr:MULTISPECIES: hypothetical protein [Undibacterium]MBC3883286.1 hypothetical protein [Undibacterium nitidum]MBC3893567.1 hypothetical protein [Undibacterium sp. LX40W]